MNTRYWLCLVAAALSIGLLGYKGFKPASPDGGAPSTTAAKMAGVNLNLIPVQTLQTVGSVHSEQDFQKLVATYEEDLTRLSRRIQASADDRWYVSSHKFVVNKQIGYDLSMVLADVDTITKVELPQSSASARLRAMRATLKQDTERLSASVQNYAAQTTQIANDQALPAVKQNLLANQKRMVTIKKLANMPTSSTATL